jgi:uncharacterized protein (TIGR00299 family) protein
MTEIAYFDCFSGCSGDMIIGSLLDAGLDLEVLKKGLAGLNVCGYQLTAEKVKRAAIVATKFTVITDKTIQQHRSLSHILQIIDSSQLSDNVKKKSCAIFQRLGEVEAKIHGVDIDNIHFHELGAVDSIVDIIGTVFALEVLGLERLYSSPLPMGSGKISAAHGILPVPAPATLQLFANGGVPVTPFPESDTITGELVTPTGAVLLTSLAVFTRPGMVIQKVGYGAGSKDFAGWPNVLRIWIGQETEDSSEEGLVLLETNIDDMNPQIYGYLMEILFAEKAADVWFTPIQMKKNRPAVMLSVLAPSSLETKLTEIIMRETSTLGIRSRTVSRHMAHREIIEFDSSLGHARIKIKRFGHDLINVFPEYDDCRRLALERNIPLHEVSRILEIEARQYLAEHTK